MGRDTFHQTRLLKVPSNPASSTSREEGASTASLGNLLQCLTILTVKNFFLIPNLNLPSFSLKPRPLALSLPALVKRSLPSFLAGPFRYWKAVIRSSQSLLFSRLNRPNSLSLSSQQSCSSPQIIFAASSGPAPTAPCLSHTEGSRARCRTPGKVSLEQSRGTESPPLTCWPCCWGCSPEYGWPSGL